MTAPSYFMNLLLTCNSTFYCLRFLGDLTVPAEIKEKIVTRIDETALGYYDKKSEIEKIPNVKSSTAKTNTAANSTNSSSSSNLKAVLGIGIGAIALILLPQIKPCQNQTV